MYKNLLLTLALGSMSMGAFAEHHGYYWMPSEEDVLNCINSVDGVARQLNPWFTTELILPNSIDGTFNDNSTVYPASNGTNDMLNKQSYFAEGGSYADDVTGAIMDYNFNNGYLEVTVPSQLTNPLSNPPTFSGNDGIALFHLRLGSSPYRINDATNTLSYDGHRAYLSDCTGAYVGVKAPAGSKVVVYFTTTNMSTSTINKNVGGAADSDPAGSRTTAFDCGTVPSDDYVELTSGAAQGSLTGLTYNDGTKWVNGYCFKNVDIAVYGLSVGDKVGLAGLQTLHDGWTPVPFDYTSGIEAVSADVDANAPVEYFNIQGVKVAADNLTPGLYITRQGNKATKVLVK